MSLEQLKFLLIQLCGYRTAWNVPERTYDIYHMKVHILTVILVPAMRTRARENILKIAKYESDRQDIFRFLLYAFTRKKYTSKWEIHQIIISRLFLGRF